MTFRSGALVFLFAATMFVSAGLLFSVQPLVSKMLLPLLGGTPAVWNTCTVFFQALLLAGYAYAHLTTSRLGAKWQLALHGLLLVLAMIALPLSISEEGLLSAGTESDPTLWLLGTLALSVGLPFFVLATTAPFLQRWFSRTNHPQASDPYFLYAASNFGSLVALLGYPLWLESRFRLSEQNSVWAAGYGIFALAVLICLVVARCASGGRMAGGEWQMANGEWQMASGKWERRCDDRHIADDALGENDSRIANHKPQMTSWPQRLRWVFFAFVPSSLLLGVTTYLTTDIGSIALLWVVPLAIYLLTYIIAFGSTSRRLDGMIGRALPAGAVALAFLIVSEATEPGWLLVLVHLVFFFIAALGCHLRLARERPPAEQLTGFYLWISVGGVLGGAFNAMVAPHLFKSVLEYPLMILMACLVRRRHSPENGTRDQWGDWLLPACLGGVTLVFVWALSGADWMISQVRLGLMFGIPVVLSYLFVDRPLRFALGLGAVLLAAGSYAGSHGHTLYAERNFFGVLRVTIDPNGESRRLVHGNTVHGRQYVDAARESEPLSYYHRTGPLGDIFHSFQAKPGASRVAVVGLGTGSILSYARPEEQWTYYEINPAVYDIARNTNYFTYLNSCAAGTFDVVLGDARLRMREAEDAAFDLIVLDAFSSDAIPVHLITREAIELYLDKLAPGGLLAFHISNRWLDLEPVLGDLARDARLICHAFDEMTISARDEREGKDHSHWVVMARERVDMGQLVKDCQWLPVNARDDVAVWSDDFSNLLDALKWR